MAVCTVGHNSHYTNLTLTFSKLIWKNPESVPKIVPDREESGGNKLADSRCDTSKS